VWGCYFSKFIWKRQASSRQWVENYRRLLYAIFWYSRVAAACKIGWKSFARDRFVDRFLKAGAVTLPAAVAYTILGPRPYTECTWKFWRRRLSSRFQPISCAQSIIRCEIYNIHPTPVLRRLQQRGGKQVSWSLSERFYKQSVEICTLRRLVAWCGTHCNLAKNTDFVYFKRIKSIRIIVCI